MKKKRTAVNDPKRLGRKEQTSPWKTGEKDSDDKKLPREQLAENREQKDRNLK